MVALPVLIATLLPRTVPLPAAAVLPSLLVLPRDCLLLRTLRWLLLGPLLLRPLLLSLLDPLLLRLLLLGLLDLLLLLRPLLLSLLDPLLLRLLLLGLLDPLLLRLLLLSLLDPLLLLRLLLLGLLDPLLLRLLLLGLLDLLLLLRPLLLSLLDPLLLRLLVLSLLDPLLLRLLVLSLLDLLLLRVLLLCGWPRALRLSTLVRFRFTLFFVLLFVLRVNRDNRREKQKQGSGTCSSSELHCNHPPLTSPLGVHADGHSVYLCSTASAASASALVLCSVPSGTNLASPCSSRKNWSTFGCTSSPISSPGLRHITASWACFPVNNTWRKDMFSKVCFSIGPTYSRMTVAACFLAA
jgi:hypothetical protein